MRGARSTMEAFVCVCMFSFPVYTINMRRGTVVCLALLALLTEARVGAISLQEEEEVVIWGLAKDLNLLLEDFMYQWRPEHGPKRLQEPSPPPPGDLDSRNNELEAAITEISRLGPGGNNTEGLRRAAGTAGHSRDEKARDIAILRTLRAKTVEEPFGTPAHGKHKTAREVTDRRRALEAETGEEPFRIPFITAQRHSPPLQSPSTANPQPPAQRPQPQTQKATTTHRGALQPAATTRGRRQVPPNTIYRVSKPPRPCRKQNGGIFKHSSGSAMNYISFVANIVALVININNNINNNNNNNNLNSNNNVDNNNANLDINSNNANQVNIMPPGGKKRRRRGGLLQRGPPQVVCSAFVRATLEALLTEWKTVIKRREEEEEEEEGEEGIGRGQIHEK